MNLQERFEELKRFVCMNQAHEFDTIVSILEQLVNADRKADNYGILSALVSLINDMLDRDKLVLYSRACTLKLTRLFVERVSEVLLQIIVEDIEGVLIHELYEFVLSTGGQYRLYRYYVSSISSIDDLDEGIQLVDVLMRCIELLKYMKMVNYFNIK